MALIEQLKPLVLGPFVRALAIYIEIVTFSLTLLTSGGILSITSFAVLGIIIVTDVVLCVRTRKAQLISRRSDQRVETKPKVGIMVFDFVAGVLFLISWICFLLLGGVPLLPDNIYYAGYSTFGAFVLIGDLSIAHVHIIMGSIAAHAIRQQKNGQKAARREQNKHGNAVLELAEPVEAGQNRSL